MIRFHTLAALFVAALLHSQAALAGDGHAHGDEAPALVGEALPRFAAVSESFELVGVLKGKQITLYLDRYADNSPVRGAQIELDIGGAKFKARAVPGRPGEETYEVVLPAAPEPGVLPITATVLAGNEADLLAGELDIHGPAHADEAAHTLRWALYAGWAAAGMAGLSLLAWGGRRAWAARRLHTQGAA